MLDILPLKNSALLFFAFKFINIRTASSLSLCFLFSSKENSPFFGYICLQRSDRWRRRLPMGGDHMQRHSLLAAFCRQR
jgi:hypothetical protein